MGACLVYQGLTKNPLISSLSFFFFLLLFFMAFYLFLLLGREHGHFAVVENDGIGGDQKGLDGLFMVDLLWGK